MFVCKANRFSKNNKFNTLFLKNRFFFYALFLENVIKLVF